MQAMTPPARAEAAAAPAIAPPPPATKPGTAPLGAQEQAGPPTAPHPAARGGPDAFGYVYDDSREPNGPLFSWIAGTNVITRLHTDDMTTTVALPFALNFYGA